MHTCIGTPSPVDHTTLGGRIARGMIVILCLGLAGVGGFRWLHREAQLQQFRTTLQKLAYTVQTIQPRAAARHRPMILRIDATRGVFQLAALQGGRRSYETVEQTIWLPKGLEIAEAPASLTVPPAGHLAATTIVVTAPSYNRLFRLTTTARGLVRLDEEPSI